MPEPRYHPLVLTCEHASNRWPSRWGQLVQPPADVLKSHRGWDPGALDLARALARSTQAPLLEGAWSRLLVELNRSPHHRHLWSEFSRRLPHDARQVVFNEVYVVFRTRALDLLKGRLAAGSPVIHVSVHTFTPELNGRPRTTDIGLLYDPQRNLERRFCQAWRDALETHVPRLRVRFNYPYRGSADGHTTALRKAFVESDYLGIELEVNQEQPLAGGDRWKDLKSRLAESLAATVRSI